MLLVACGGGTTSPARTPVAPADGAMSVRAFEWGFEPASIVLRRGEEVRLDFVNEGATLHDLKIDGLDATAVASEGSGLSGDDGELFVAADDGKSGVLVFTPTESGEFDFYCTLPRHRSLGMKGTLVVE